jgi:hypothetical protein
VEEKYPAVRLHGKRRKKLRKENKFGRLEYISRVERGQLELDRRCTGDTSLQWSIETGDHTAPVQFDHSVN